MNKIFYKITMNLFLVILNFFKLKASGEYHEHENIGDYKNLSNTRYDEIESFDLQSSLNFIKNIGRTSCLSPLYEEVIRHCQEYRDATDEDKKASVKEKLWRIYTLIRMIDPKVLDIYFDHMLGETNKEFLINHEDKTDKLPDSYL